MLTIHIEDLENIIKSYKQFQVNQVFSFLRYYLVIQRWTNFEGNQGKRHVANSTIGHIIADNRTIKKYNDILQELRIFWYENGYRSMNSYKEISTRFARCRDIEEAEFREQVADWAFENGYEKFDKEHLNELKSLKATKRWEKIRYQEYLQQVRAQFADVSDNYLKSLLVTWGLENDLSISDFKRAIIENEILIGGHPDFEDENLEMCARWASRGIFNRKKVKVC